MFKAFTSMRAAARRCAIGEASFAGLAIGTPAILDPRTSWRNDKIPINNRLTVSIHLTKRLGTVTNRKSPTLFSKDE